jgi:hypothetical protein
MSRYTAYRAKEPFKPLFSDEDLERLTRSKRTTVATSAANGTKADRFTSLFNGSSDSSAPLLNSYEFYPVHSAASRDSSLYDTPVRSKKSSLGTGVAKVHPEFDSYSEYRYLH